MIIFGIDPGTTTIGYAVVDGEQMPRLLTCGLIPIKTRHRAERLQELHRHLKRLLKRWRPDALSTERHFFSKNVKTALEVSEARGVILLTTALARCPVYEYTPLEIKKIVTGDGRADKAQLKKMVHLTLHETTPRVARDDVFDAIAIALTCFFSSGKHAR